MRKLAKHPCYHIPDAGESQQDIVSRNKPLSKKIRNPLNDPDHTPEKHKGMAPNMGHADVPASYGESYKDIKTKEAYDGGFVSACELRGVDPVRFAKVAGLKDIYKSVSYAMRPNPGKIKLPQRVLGKIDRQGLDLSGLLDDPGIMEGMVLSTPKRNRQYALKLIKKIRGGETIMHPIGG